MKRAIIVGAVVALSSASNAHAVDKNSVIYPCSAGAQTYLCAYTYTALAHLAEAIAYTNGNLSTRASSSGLAFS